MLVDKWGRNIILEASVETAILEERQSMFPPGVLNHISKFTQNSMLKTFSTSKMLPKSQFQKCPCISSYIILMVTKLRIKHCYQLSQCPPMNGISQPPNPGIAESCFLSPLMFALEEVKTTFMKCS